MADNRDLCYFDITIGEDNGDRVTDAENEIKCEVSGGELLGFFGANPANEDVYTSGKCHAFDGRAVAIVRTRDKCEVKLSVYSEGKEWGSDGVGDVAYDKLARGYLIMDAKNSNILMPFEDVPENEWYYKAVKRVYNAGLMNGTSDKTFEPDRPMTRAEMAQVLSNFCEKINDIVKEDKNASGTSD